MIAVAQCEDALYLVEVGETAEEDLLLAREPGGTVDRPRPVEVAPEWVSSLLVDVDAAGSTVVVLVDRKPPLLVSHDAGGAWTELGGGLPPGKAVAVGANPDDLLYGGATGSSSRGTAGSSGARSPSSSPKSATWPGDRVPPCDATSSIRPSR